MSPIFPSKTSWDFSRKEADSIIQQWQMCCQACKFEGSQFLELMNSNESHLLPAYVKGGTWLWHISHSNTLCTCLTHLITNHAPIEEYRQRFFPCKEKIKYISKHELSDL